MLYRIDELEDVPMIDGIAEYLKQWCLDGIKDEYGNERSMTLDEIMYSSNVNGCLYASWGGLEDITMLDTRSIDQLTPDEIENLKWDLNYKKYDSTAFPDNITVEEVLEYYKDFDFVYEDFCGCSLEEAENERRRANGWRYWR